MGGSEVILLCILLGSVGFFMLLIFLVPLHIRMKGSFGGEEWVVALVMSWAGLGIRVDNRAEWEVNFLVGNTPVMRIPLPSDEDDTRSEDAGGEEEPGIPDLQTIREAGAALPHLVRFLRDLFAHTGVEKIRLWFRGGFGDPIITGEVFGVVQALNGMLWPTPVRLEMEPLFTDEDAAGEAELSLCIRRPVALFVSAGRMALQPESRAAIQTMTRGEG
ncbi:hypothetical protein J2129_002288 [Methanofollis sp. W23]|uniref:DUF2953 domain-containing protein n=1 Tax=Methanofollis sp. W23 TaxID=2817849 RepID=UPI001AEAE13F|nr:DUF2953 domain-containing protein [Methanofollis sp. W23]MBP2146834.1 hypothetical protein [Methanofollis sp. W23]